MSNRAEYAEPPSDRLERFRALRARLDPAGDPARALADGLYVESGRSVGARIAAELAVAPASTHLLIGGVGSGKTTELLEAQRRLHELTDTRAFYVDVTQRHDIEKMVPGVLAVQVGLALVGEETESVEPAHVVELRQLAHGYWAHSDGDWDPYDPSTHVGGILVPAGRLAANAEYALKLTKPQLEIVRAASKHVVVLLDGLDRMSDMAALQQIIEHDVKGLASLGIGVVLVGPLRALYGIDRTFMDHFDTFHQQPWIDQKQGAGPAIFLRDVLRKRAPQSALDGQGLEALAHHSGGVLRDLLALAQSACVEAYLEGVDLIGLVQADSAIDAFGRKHMQGLRADEIEVLQRVRTKATFVQTSEDDLALLMTRRILEYRNNGRARYAVHPTIERFLEEIAGE